MQKEFTSEKFQDFIDKKEASMGIERPGNPYNDEAAKNAEKNKGKKKKGKKKKGKKKKKASSDGDAESGSGSDAESGGASKEDL